MSDTQEGSALSSSSTVSQETGKSQNAAGDGKSAFMTLAGFIFGKNDRKEKMAMTMPVFSDSSGRMQFFMGNNKVYTSWQQLQNSNEHAKHA